MHFIDVCLIYPKINSDKYKKETTLICSCLSLTFLSKGMITFKILIYNFINFV